MLVGDESMVVVAFQDGVMCDITLRSGAKLGQ